MSEIPKSLKYSKDHEWIILEGNIATIGITQHAAESLGDIVYVDINSIDKELKQFDKFGEIESVKAVSDLYVPISGKVIETNAELESNPEFVNDDCYDKGWIIKVQIEDSNELKNLLDSTEYEKII
ncbi:MAG: glycine cleavage system protein GcvH [Dehalococcoidia bacterium]|nr:glycine cleavage system protein GcvH [Dehalococcoidia bacterium]